jgi:predicted Zn-dependent protease with MMP-like domain
MLHSIKVTHAIEGLEKWASRTGLPDGVADKIITELGDIFGLTDSEIARILEGGN